MDYVKYKDAQLPINLGCKAINQIAKNKNLQFEDVLNSSAPLAALEFVNAVGVSGLNDGARKAGLDKTYTEDDVWDMFDEEPQLISELSTAFREAVTSYMSKLGSLVPNEEKKD